ncbi:hypothetical protein LY90DRAFT_506161 [Neocallimastix californiae]|uniref:PSI domain-containing protein n=1 Tax=Neocallimastix californiae TaxID=1754190 RepID=A0A1Y2DIM5_9FUNG|nr:hypothetical protein LY90DRAFT_506161 [Neocallimastix californiae]|eukprot:ORY59006.1 hypothetical protein LY90DRAFT_506161 [Neocallimastix californiae]
MVILVYILIILYLNVLLTSCSKQLKCESFKDEIECKKNNDCQWCNSQWGCMTNVNSMYDCPTECVTTECYRIKNIDFPIFYNYDLMDSNQRKNIIFEKVKVDDKTNFENDKTDKNYTTVLIILSFIGLLIIAISIFIRTVIHRRKKTNILIKVFRNSENKNNRNIITNRSVPSNNQFKAKQNFETTINIKSNNYLNPVVKNNANPSFYNSSKPTQGSILNNNLNHVNNYKNNMNKINNINHMNKRV